MSKILIRVSLLSVVALAPAVGTAQNLLTNGDLNLTTPGENFDLPADWVLTTDPNSLGPEPARRFPGFQADYAEHTNPGGAGTMGMVFNSSEGNFPGFESDGFPAVDAHLSQTVTGVPGRVYTMSGWAYFEGGYAGGVDDLADDSPTTRAGMPALTDTFFALEFLDLNDDVLAGSKVIELKAAGQVNNPDQTEETRNWMQHALTAVAPLGTVKVQVRASMVDGEFNIDLPHQAAWVDDFSLTSVPEPATWMMGLSAAALASVFRRRK